ncbi:restriction endonuclease subunit S [Streptomyces atratus]|uniref:Restriction endonuclease S subunit n=1 Tax=Streptomyces atratus TaxID=1893 RepID=A0A1K2CQZ8_STRAR|nr:restriction endonuclease subunit S [Streptomyces atratus]SFY13323.1 Restriction endonuclease S subunit [Streptomyces atratus]
MAGEVRVERRKLSDLADVTGGVTLGREVPASESVELPYLRVANVQDGYIDTEDVKAVRVLKSEVDRFRLRRGDVLLTEGGDFDKLGRGAVWDGRIDPCLYQNHIFRVRCNPSHLVPEYLSLFMASPEGRSYFLRIAKQTTNLATINSSQLKAMPVPWPSIAEQRRIAGALDVVSAEENSIEASITKIRAVRQGVLLRAMPLGAQGVPLEDWQRVTLKAVVPSTDYGISEALVSDPQGMPVLRMNNIRDGQVDTSELRYCPTSVPDRLVLRHGDVLFNRTNSIEHVGKAAMWKDDLPKATFASYLVRLNPDLRQITPEYLVEWLQHPIIRQRVKAISTVAVQQVNVNPTRLRDLEIDLPISLDEQRRIVSSLTACDDRIRREEEELAKLRQLKIGLADDLLAGRGGRVRTGLMLTARTQSPHRRV